MYKLKGNSCKSSLLSLVFFSLALVSLKAQDSSAVYKAYTTVLAEAKAQEKVLLLVLGFKTCPPCLALEKEVFESNDSRDFIQQNFIVHEVDVRKSDAKFLQQKFRVNGFPTSIFINTQGFLLDKITGFSTAENYLSKCTQALEKLQAGAFFPNLSATYKRGEFHNFSPRLMSKNQLEVYLDSNNAHTFNSVSWGLITTYLSPPSKHIDWALHNLDTLKTLYPAEEIEDFQDKIFWKYAETMVEEHPNDYENYITAYIQQFKLKEEKTLLRKALWDAYFYAENVEQLFKLTKGMVRSGELESGVMQSVAILALKNGATSELYKMLLLELEPLLTNSQDYNLLKTAAHLAFTVKEYTKAELYAEQSLKFCKQQFANCNEIEALLLRIKQAYK